MRFRNGSSGVISYVTGGNTRFPKETFDAAAGGRSARLDNFRKATVWAGRGHSTSRAQAARTRASEPNSPSSSRPVLTGAPMPIPLEALVAVTSATIAVRESLSSGRPERV